MTLLGIYNVKKLVVVTGLSGSGKSSTLNILEDQGLFAVDNIPAALLPQLLELLGTHDSAVVNGVVVVVDVRGKDLDRFVTISREIRARVEDFSVVFLDATDKVLVQRFNTTRRSHPLGDGVTILEGIKRERDLLASIRQEADIIVDTSNLDIRSFRPALLKALGSPDPQLTVLFSSFGFKHGIPNDSDYVMDVRFLPNPYYVPSLRDLTGTDEPVKQYVKEQFPDWEAFLDKTVDFFEFLLPQYGRVGKSSMHIAIGCTGGRHRSVAMVEWLESIFEEQGYRVTYSHRDIDKH